MGLYKIIEKSLSTAKQGDNVLGSVRQSVRRSPHTIPPAPAYGSMWVVLWLFCFRSAHSMFPQKTGHLLWGHFWESLVFRLHSKFGQTDWARSILELKLSVTTTDRYSHTLYSAFDCTYHEFPDQTGVHVQCTCNVGYIGFAVWATITLL